MDTFTLELTWFGMAHRACEIDDFLYKRLGEDYIVESVKSLLCWELLSRSEATFEWLLDRAKDICQEVLPPEIDYPKEELVF